MKKFEPFQLALSGIFALIAVAGFIAFISFQGSRLDTVNLNVWTDVANSDLWRYAANKDVEGVSSVIVREFASEGFVDDVIRELSLPNSAQLPDIIFTSSANQRALGERLQSIPFTSLTQSQFKDNYIGGVYDEFLTADGFAGIPFAADVLVLYTNETKLNELGIATRPTYWDEVSQIVNTFTKRRGTVVDEVILPLGTVTNITNAQEIFFTLLGQVGIQALSTDASGRVTSNLRDDNTLKVLSYYTDFANTNSGVYNWNISYPSDREVFTANSSVFYLDFASQADVVQKLNPNIKIAHSEIPQVRGNKKYVEARYYGAYFPAVSNKVSTSIPYLVALTNDQEFLNILEQSNLISPKRSLINSTHQDQLLAVASRSVLYSGANPIFDQGSYQDAFAKLIEDVLYRGIAYTQALRDYADTLEETIK